MMDHFNIVDRHFIPYNKVIYNTDGSLSVDRTFKQLYALDHNFEFDSYIINPKYIIAMFVELMGKLNVTNT